MVEYYVYGYILKSNKDLHMLTPYTGQANQGEIKLNIKINDIWNRTNNNPNISVQYKKNEVVLDIGKMVEYRIYYTENQIFVDATDFAWVESTFLNLPFALFFSQKNMLLLHASCLSIGKIIVPLCAPKGTGKTTATVGLSKFYNFYSDDTVLLRLENGNVLGYYGTRLVKLTKDSYDYLISDDGFEVLSKNLQGKAYFEVHENAEIDLGHVEKVFFLQRAGNEVKAEIISNRFTRKILLHSNICGTGTLGYEYCKSIEKNYLFKFLLDNFEFLKIIVRDDKVQLSMTLLEIKQIIDNNIKLINE